MLWHGRICNNCKARWPTTNLKRRFALVIEWAIFFDFLLAALLCGATTSLAQTAGGTANSGSAGYVGDQACAGCHSSIYNSYEKTSMGQASGPAITIFFPLISYIRNPGCTIAFTPIRGKSGSVLSVRTTQLSVASESCSITLGPGVADELICLPWTDFCSSRR